MLRFVDSFIDLPFHFIYSNIQTYIYLFVYLSIVLNSCNTNNRHSLFVIVLLTSYKIDHFKSQLYLKYKWAEWAYFTIHGLEPICQWFCCLCGRSKHGAGVRLHKTRKYTQNINKNLGILSKANINQILESDSAYRKALWIYFQH